MTADPAVLDTLAAHDEHLTRISTLITGITRTLEDHQAALTRLQDTGRPAPGQSGGYEPGPAPAWWQLTGPARQDAIAALRPWVEQVYRPGYGHLAAALGPCWAAHDLCLYGIDIAAALWSVLYLQPARTPALISSQAEYQTRILPALTAQLMTETTRCNHLRSTP